MIHNDEMLTNALAGCKLVGEVLQRHLEELDKFFAEYPLGTLTLSVEECSYSPNVGNRLRKFGKLYVHLPTEADVIHIARLYKDNGYTVTIGTREAIIQATI